jgi:hypothetical protein
MKQPISIAAQRLFALQIAKPTFHKPEDVVFHLGAMQAQEFAMAKWAIGMRLTSATEKVIDHAFTTGKILRTHLLRPTWHFVSPQDIRWLLMLTAPRINQISAYMHRQSELNTPLFNKANKIIEKALTGNKQLTREELGEHLAQKGIPASGSRLGYIMMRAELDAVVCSGARKGNQFTYALLEERVPQQKTFTRDEALHELIMRYFNSRGLASATDFSYWSGLTMADTNKGIKQASTLLQKENINGHEYFYTKLHTSATINSNCTFLMPDYDEYGASFKNREALQNPDFSAQISFNRMLVLDGTIVGTWKRTLKNDTVLVDLNLNVRLNSKQQKQVQTAAKQYADFLEKKLITEVSFLYK